MWDQVVAAVKSAEAILSAHSLVLAVLTLQVSLLSYQAVAAASAWLHCLSRMLLLLTVAVVWDQVVASLGSAEEILSADCLVPVGLMLQVSQCLWCLLRCLRCLL